MDPRHKAFLDSLAWSEGTSTHPLTANDGYDVIVTGVNGPNVFTDYSDHPFASGRIPITVRRVPLLQSTASGRYQILRSTWLAYKAMLHLHDFSPASQDAIAIELIRERGGLMLIDKGDIADAFTRCGNIWASLPNNDYRQGGHTLDELTAKYAGFVAASQSQTEAA